MSEARAEVQTHRSTPGLLSKIRCGSQRQQRKSSSCASFIRVCNSSFQARSSLSLVGMPNQPISPEPNQSPLRSMAANGTDHVLIHVRCSFSGLKLVQRFTLQVDHAAPTGNAVLDNLGQGPNPVGSLDANAATHLLVSLFNLFDSELLRGVPADILLACSIHILITFGSAVRFTTAAIIGDDAILQILPSPGSFWRNGPPICHQSHLALGL